MTTVLSTSNLTKQYGDIVTVDQLNLNIPSNCVYGFLGPNGAGKSTTLKMILGLIHPTSGSVSIFGTQALPKTQLSLLKDIGSLIESPSYYEHLTGLENLKIAAAMKDLDYKAVDEVLDIVGLTEYKNRKTKHYSLGMKQRLGIAAALLGFPKLLILDEPTNGLDPAGIQEMRSLITSLPKDFDMTVIVSSHLLSEVDQMADYVGIINEGKLLFEGDLSQLHASHEGETLEDIFLSLTTKLGKRSSL